MLSRHVFNDLIGQSTKLMKKCLMKISPKRKWDFKSMETLSRKHQNVKILDFNINESVTIQSVIDGVTNVGSFVRHFELYDCRISMNDLVSLLQAMKLLTRVGLINVKESQRDLKESPEFDFLTQLKFIECDCWFEVFKKAKKIKEIHFQADCKNVDLKNFEEILMNQTNLQSLLLINLKSTNFLANDLIFPFQIKSLTVQNCHFKTKENFELFLDRQNSLTDVDLTISNMKLYLDRIRYFEDSLKILTTKKTLKTFSLEINEYKFSSTNFLNQNVNENVKKLKLNFAQTNFPFVSILKVFPNVDSLEISIQDINDSNIETLNKNLMNIKHLKIIKFPSEIFAKLRMKFLKSLHIHETNIQVEQWLEFLEKHLNITKLIINFTFFMNIPDDFIDTITKKLKLEHLELIDKLIGMKNDIYKNICENCKTLKYLKLWNINVEKNFDENDKNYLRSGNISFHLFNDESLNSQMILF